MQQKKNSKNPSTGQKGAADARAVTRRLAKNIREGRVILNEERVLSPELKEQARRSGAVIFNRNGLAVSPEQLVEEARTAVTQPITLRLSTGGLEAAKALAEKTGKGYQTILKEIIHEGLQRAS